MKTGEAIACFQHAINAVPGNADAHYNLGNALKDGGRTEEAAEAYEKALSLNASHADALNNLGNLLKDLGNIDGAIDCYRRLLSTHPEYVPAYSNLVYALYFNPARTAHEFREVRRLIHERFEAPFEKTRPAHTNTRDASRKLRIGYVSPDFRNHPIAYFIEPVLSNHNKGQVEIFCYSNHVRKDEVTSRLAGHADHWIDCARMADDLLAEKIRQDGIDILVDLAGHTGENRLPVFARKPAPVQITYLGYPGSTWLSAVDYRLTDGHADPDGSEVYYSENLLRLPHSLWCYLPPREAPDVSPLPAMHNNCITFGVFCNFNKIDLQSIELWAGILRESPESRLIVVGVPGEKSRMSLAAAFESLGVSGMRLEIDGKLPLPEFRKKLQQVDIALDPAGINSPTTMCECLWMGVPTISLYGDRCSSRAGLSVLSAAGLEELAAGSTDQYREIARSLSTNRPGLNRMRNELRQKISESPLTDAVAFTRHLEETYRHIWMKWCEKATVSY